MMAAVAIAAVGIAGIVGIAVVCVVSKSEPLKRAKKPRKVSVTKFLFVTTQLAALFWVSASYLIAAYATVKLGQPYPVVELSQQAITTVLGVNVLKVAENAIEHNDGGLFGHSRKEGSEDSED